MTQPCFYVTTPIYYVNDKPHIGHAYTTISCDTLARFKRLDGHNVKFITGTDEHGQKVYQAAEKRGVPPQQHVDETSENFKNMCALLHITHDRFIRTTDADHKAAAQALWNRLVENGSIYSGSYAGWYAVRDEAYYNEDELTTDAAGQKIAPTGAPCTWMEEESYFFRLSAWQDKLLELYESRPDFIQPASRRNEVISFVKGGLKDLSVSRTTFNWGIPVPGNDKHVMYVWIDALTNYITALGYPDTQTQNFRDYWPQAVHVVGKDILRFHAVYWPAFLMAAGLGMPNKIFAHGWWMVEGEKMSKSLGNTISPEHIVATYGLDQARYALLREVSFGNDGDFTHKHVVARLNAELANNIGNLVQRTLSMIQKNCAGAVPAATDLTAADHALLDICGPRALDAVRAEMDQLHFSFAIEHIVQAANAANQYIDEQAPWALKKTDPARMGTVLYVLAESIRNIALLLRAFTPDAAGKILSQLAVDENSRDLSFVGAAHRLTSGTPLPVPAGVFPRIQDESADAA